MAKRLFSTDKRAEKILSYLRDNNENISAFISAAVVDEILPVYSQLRIEALYLLDFMIDGAKDWSGNKLILATGEDELEFYTKQTLGRGVSWLQRNHHIRNGDVLRAAINFYHENAWSGGVALDELNDYQKDLIKRMRKKLKEINPEYQDYYVGLGSLGRDVLDHWDKLWDDNEAYDILHSVIWAENANKKIDPFVVIKMLQMMENQFIIEAIGERSR